MSAQLSLELFDAPAVPKRIGAAQVVVTDSRHLLNAGKGRTSDYDFTLNPYRGCTFGCAYCFAAFFVPDDARREAWGSWVEAKTEAVAALRRRDLGNKRIFMSTATDPYQPIEAKLRLTRSILEELLRQQARVMVQTRSPFVAADIDLLRRFRHLRVNVSVTTDSDAVRRKFEPHCASIERRLETLRELKANGIRIGLCLSPMLPMEDPERFGRMLRELDPHHATTAWFHFSQRAFASSTREKAIRLLEESGWTRADFDRCVAAVRREFPALTTFGEGFRPE
jgi:DNA repair photolyase